MVWVNVQLANSGSLLSHGPTRDTAFPAHGWEEGGDSDNAKLMVWAALCWLSLSGGALNARASGLCVRIVGNFLVPIRSQGRTSGNAKLMVWPALCWLSP